MSLSTRLLDTGREGSRECNQQHLREVSICSELSVLCARKGHT